jgi:hypothetical protein
VSDCSDKHGSEGHRDPGSTASVPLVAAARFLGCLETLPLTALVVISSLQLFPVGSTRRTGGMAADWATVVGPAEGGLEADEHLVTESFTATPICQSPCHDGIEHTIGRSSGPW